tara:strand:+ start:2335 stop:6162 length:3828 start_codon:yes stop_codon:yes gene_type:complete
MYFSKEIMINRISLYIFLITTAFNFSLNAQNQIKVDLNWGDPIYYGLEGNKQEKTLFFSEAQYDFADSKLPFLYLNVGNLKSRSINQAVIENENSIALTEDEIQLLQGLEIEGEPQVYIENSLIKKENHAYIKINPFFRFNGRFFKLTNFTVSYSTISKPLKRNKALSFASNSKMSSGDWYKIGVTKEGAYKLNYQFLNSLGIDVENLDPRTLKVYGYGGGSLPESNDEDRPDDMLENPILAIGENDGKFNRNDYFVFYGDNQVEWQYDTSKNHFKHRLNPYSDTTFYFIAITPGNGKRIQAKSIPSGVITNTVTSYDYLSYHEVDQVNLIQSGREWLGEPFDNILTYNFSWDIPNLIVNEEASFEFFGVARAGVTSTFSIKAENSNFTSSAGATVLSRYEVAFGKVSRGINSFPLVNNPVNISVTYNKPQAVAKAWLNFINLNVRRSLVMSGSFMSFRDIESVGTNQVSEFFLQSNNSVRIWDVTDVANIQSLQLTQQGANYKFIDETSNLNEYLAFSAADSINIIPIGKVPNQNLHAFSQADMIIVTNPKFYNQAEQLAQFHREEGLTVQLATTHQIYNEFSSGAQDIIAIRTFAKMFYDRATNASELPRYLLLFGDASYDLKNRLSGNTNYVVSYQSPNFLQPVYSYVSDDFLGLLDDEEGTWPNTTVNPEKMDIAVGRIPSKTVQEAAGVVAKIKQYNTTNNLADWRNKIVFVGDDEDGVTHMSQSNQLATLVDLNDPDMELDKVYLDAYNQESTAGGSRYPEVNKAINRAVQDGALLINYTGHGGETGWAGERILSIEDITSWDKKTNMPVFVTATCEFSRFDDPFRTSAGELVLLNPNGGGAALMTTTRLVYSSPNYTLNRSFYNFVFERDNNGDFKRVGDIFMETKNANAGSSNSRNFSLLGDPALKLAIPKYQVITTEVNGRPLGQADTLKALSQTTISGYVADENGNKMTQFNGYIYPTVYDKSRNVKTLNNDGGGVFEFEKRDSRIFKGKASVNQGDFSFSFIVPKDINYSYGNGKVYYYAENGSVDANGYSQQLIVGGSNDSALTDQEGPQIDLFMNDESFVYGGITNSSPLLLAKLFDNQGVNTVGSGLGHDLVAVLDGNTENSFILNDFYEAETDSYQKGVIRFPFEDLDEGKHTITLKAWDVANNSSEKTIEFMVYEDKQIEIKNLVNYPNPFTTNTEFIFQHNQAGVPLDVKLEIFTVSGKLVKSFNQVIVNEGYLSRDIRWNGKDEFGDSIGKGVYVYKLQVRARNGSSIEKFEKLVIL